MNAFICAVPLHYYFFKSIYNHLNDAIFVIPPVADSPFMKTLGGGLTGGAQFNYIYSFLASQNVKVADYGTVTAENFVRYINDNIKNVVCPHMFTGIERLKNKRIIKLVYGIPSDTRSLRYEYLYLMDLILTFGQESVNRISTKKIPSVPIGNPLFDDWYNDKVDSKSCDLIKKRLDLGKETILYLPTWGGDSSLDNYIEEIASLAHEYNVIIKLHHCTFSGEMNRLHQCMSYPDLIVLGDYFDPLPLYKVSNKIITDGMSGATFDAIMLGKTVLTIGSSVKNYGLNENKKSAANIFSFLDNVPLIENPKELKNALKQIKNKTLEIRPSIKEQIYFRCDGLAGERAAKAILDIERYPSSPMLEKFNRGINGVADSNQKNIILGAKNIFLNYFYPTKNKKTPLFSKISQWLSTR
ncbi:MAG: CDP-glycerol glycerophosphotransferase family protein [Patescibacteria group bacterium]|jgi:hypothetical protein